MIIYTYCSGLDDPCSADWANAKEFTPRKPPAPTASEPSNAAGPGECENNTGSASEKHDKYYNNNNCLDRVSILASRGHCNMKYDMGNKMKKIMIIINVQMNHNKNNSIKVIIRIMKTTIIMVGLIMK